MVWGKSLAAYISDAYQEIPDGLWTVHELKGSPFFYSPVQFSARTPYSYRRLAGSCEQFGTLG
jgi:hypothetical protein